MKGMFQQVSEMNTAFGNPKGNPTSIDWERLTKQCRNILDEYSELMVALEMRNLDEVRDALCDINVFSLGAHHFIGANADDDMTAVVEGVLTRFCQNQADLDATLDKYTSLGVLVYTEGEFPTVCLKSAHDQKDINGENYPKGKFLKSVSYATTVFPVIV